MCLKRMKWKGELPVGEIGSRGMKANYLPRSKRGKRSEILETLCVRKNLKRTKVKLWSANSGANLIRIFRMFSGTQKRKTSQSIREKSAGKERGYRAQRQPNRFLGAGEADNRTERDKSFGKCSIGGRPHARPGKTINKSN